jgi:bacterioferritin
VGNRTFLPWIEEQAGRTNCLLLSKELEEKAQESMKHAKKIAKRIAELGGVQTADPTEFVMLSPLKRFSMPRSNSDVNEILSFILKLEQSIIKTYGNFLNRIRDKDYITYHVLREILEDEVKSESETESVLTVYGGRLIHAR